MFLLVVKCSSCGDNLDFSHPTDNTFSYIFLNLFHDFVVKSLGENKGQQCIDTRSLRRMSNKNSILSVYFSFENFTKSPYSLMNYLVKNRN